MPAGTAIALAYSAYRAFAGLDESDQAKDDGRVKDLNEKFNKDEFFLPDEEEMKFLEKVANPAEGEALSTTRQAQKLLEKIKKRREYYENLPESSTEDMAGGGASEPDDATRQAELDQTKEKTKNETFPVEDNRTYPVLTSFSDQIYILMQLANIVEMRIDKTKSLNNAKSPNITNKGTRNFLKREKSALKQPLPFAYLEGDQNHGVNNAVIQCYGEPYSFVNYLTSDPRYQEYMDLKPDKLSRLLPKIRFFKEFNSEGKLDIVEIKFPTDGIESKNVLDPYSNKSTSELEEFLKGRRGYGAGIENFTFTIDGTNPVTRDRSISATLTLVANSLDDLLKPRKGNSVINPFTSTNTLTYKYYDLAMHSDTGDKKREGPADESTKFGMINDLDFRILAEVGISENNDVSELSQMNSITLSLLRVNHTYKIGQDGRITLTIEYKGYIEKEFSNPVVWDCFATSKSIQNDIKKQLSEIMLKDNCDKTQIRAFHKKSIVVAENEFRKRVTSITDRLRAFGKIVYFEITTKEFQSFNTIFNNHKANIEEIKNNDDLSSSEKKTAIDQAFEVLAKHLKEATENSKLTKTGDPDKEKDDIKKSAKGESKDGKKGENPCDEVDPNRLQISFFFAGDLINLILKQMGEIYEPSELDRIFENVVTQLKKDKLFQSLLTNTDADSQLTMNKKIIEYKNNLKAKGERFKKLRIVLGPTQVSSILSGEMPMASIGDIPIALDHFNSWLSKKVQANQVRYPLNAFLKDFLTVYIPRYLKGKQNEHNGLIGIKKTISSVPFTAYNPASMTKDTDVLTSHRTKFSTKDEPGPGTLNGLFYEIIKQTDRPILDQTSKSITPSNRMTKKFDYVVFHEKRPDPVLPKLGTTSKALDTRFGIFHYQQGIDRGILKNIEFKATNIEGRREARYQKGKFNGLAQLTEVFDATVETYLDLNVMPGSKIYIDSNTLVSHLSEETRELLGDYKISEFGLGGYYIVNTVSHNIGPGLLSTTFQAQWDSWQHKRPQKKKQRSEPNKQTLSAKEKCKKTLEPITGAGGGIRGFFRSIGRFFQIPDETIDAGFDYISDTADIFKGYIDTFSKQIGFGGIFGNE